MYNLSSICFMCLNENKSLKQLLHEGAEIDTINQVKYVLPEFIFLEQTTPVKICSTCYELVNSFFTFKKMCLENYSRLRNQLITLQDTSDIQIDRHIKKEIEDPLMEEQNNQREECISSEDRKDNESDFKPIEFVKCDVSDEIQDGATSDKINFNTNNPKRPRFYYKESDAEPSNWIRTGVREFKCLLCNKAFKSKQYIKTHMKIHNGIINFQCTVCNKKFTRNSHLKDHMKLHLGIKNVECSICHKKFIQNSHLKVHLKLHVGVKDIECSICNKKFMQNSNLNVHLKMHEGVKNFECAVCKKKFMLKSTLTRHVKSHSGVKDFECNICHKKFTQNCHLKIHVLNVHPLR